MIKQIGLFLLVSVLQFVAFVVIFDWVHYTYPLSRPNIAFGIYTHYLAWFFAGIVLIVNAMFTLTGINRYSLIFMLILMVVFNIYIFGPHESYPNRTWFILLLTNGLIALPAVIALLMKWRSGNR